MANFCLPSPLLQLEPEVWSLVLKKLTQNEALNLRTVNKDFKAKVDTLYNDWVIMLDEDCPYLDMILDLRVKKVIVNGLWQPISNRPPGTIFKHPNLLKTIHIPIYMGISAENLHNLLVQSKMVQLIDISFFDSIAHDVLWSNIDSQIGYNLPKLHTLNIKVWIDFEQSIFEGNFFEKLMIRSNMPNLISMSVGFKSGPFMRLKHPICKYIKTVFLFLVRHGQTVKHFTFSYSARPEIAFTPLSPEEERCLFRNCSCLETLHLSLEFESYTIKEIWRRFILAQSQLVDLNLSTCGLEVTKWAKICRNNSLTLSRFSISRMKYDGEDEPEVDMNLTRFDISVFGKCVNLKYLKLSLTLSERIELYNLFALPSQINKVKLQGLFVRTEEISKFLKTHPNVLKILIDATGNLGQYGINLSVFEEMLNHGSIKSIVIGPHSFIVPDVDLELAQLIVLLSSMGCKNKINELQWTYVNLKKVTDSNGASKWASCVEI